jgi:hypothetical protein
MIFMFLEHVSRFQDTALCGARNLMLETNVIGGKGLESVSVSWF